MVIELIRNYLSSPAGEFGIFLAFLWGYGLYRVIQWTRKEGKVRKFVGVPAGLFALIMLLGMLNPNTGPYAQGVYYEARDEPLMGQIGVIAVVMNRMDDPRFPPTAERVLRDGKERGRAMDFSYEANESVNPWKHHHSQWVGWARANFVATFMGGLQMLWIEPDPTDGALYYATPAAVQESRYFREEVPATCPKRTTLGGHVFFGNCS